MLKHRAVTQSRVADAETQRKPLHSPEPTTLKHKGSRYTVSGQQQQSANLVAETTRDLRC
jgi:hypothetical protein